MRDGVPNRLTADHRDPQQHQVRAPPDPDVNFYAQDQWTRDRLTLQGGVRYDYLVSNYPDSSVGGVGFPYAANRDLRIRTVDAWYNWKDITPRVGAAYDVFGNGKTAVKFNLGKYLEAIGAANNDIDLNPLIRTTTQTTRGWNDTNKDYVPELRPGEPGDERRMRGDGQRRPSGSRCSGGPSTPTTSAAGAPGRHNWALGATVQQEVAPRVSVTVGYFRNWWNNWYVVDNRATALGGLHAVQHRGAARSAAAGRRRPGDQRTLQPRPEKVGPVDELAQSSENFGKQTENWHGVDLNVVARLRTGLTVQGGTSTGRRLADGCDVRANCRARSRPHGTSTNPSRRPSP